MEKQFLQATQNAYSHYGDLLTQLADIEKRISRNDTLNEAADKVFCLREMERVVEQTLKEIKRVHKVAQKTACLIEVLGDQDKAVTDYCTGKSASKKIVKIPHKRTGNEEEFDKLMEFIGVPAKVAQSELVRFHWPSLQEELNNKLEQGLPLPVKVEDSTDYIFTVRKKKGLFNE